MTIKLSVENVPVKIVFEEAGVRGPQGPDGSMGPVGPIGPVGPEGPQGIAGSPGPQGPAGPTGATGATGSQGPQGNPGPQGNDGPPGPAGPEGPQGPIGPTGNTGAQGIQGPQGPQGPTGPAGTTDWAGITGKPATFPPTLPIASSGVTGLDAAQAAQDTLIAAKADKTYVDSQDALKAPLASPALTGNPTAPTPTAGDADTSIATTAFVAAALAAAAAATSIGDAPPSSPKVGQLWWQSSTGRLFIYYQDANTSQWVEVPGPNIDTTGFVKETTGLWTPTIYGSTAAGVGTYTVQQGRWTRHGRIVYLEGSLTWTAHTGTGNIFIGGLPFGSIGNPSAICTAVYGSGLTFSGQLTGYVSASTGTGIGIQTFASGGNAAGLAMDTAASIQVNAVFATDNP